MKECLASSYSYKASKGFKRLDAYNAEVENSNAPKTVHVYRSCNNKEDVMKVSLPALSHPRYLGVL